MGGRQAALSRGKSPLAFASPEAFLCDLSGVFGWSLVGVVPPEITLAPSPTAWGREGNPPRYYIRRKLPHVRKELRFCWAWGCLPEGPGCWPPVFCRVWWGGEEPGPEAFLAVLFAPLSLEHSLGLRWPGKVLPVPAAFLCGRRSSWCERYFFQAALLPPRVSGRGEGSSRGKVCPFQSLERERSIPGVQPEGGSL